MLSHTTASARDKFETLVRTKLGALPPNSSVGAFLGSTVPAAATPTSFLESYINGIESAARQIIPS
jgi:hypothetical protein